MPGESFESVKACISAGDSFDTALEAMTQYRRKIFNNNESNKKLPVIFNDYMHCLWANPTEEKMLPLIDRAAELGCEYYCMDAGWYADGTYCGGCSNCSVAGAGRNMVISSCKKQL